MKIQCTFCRRTFCLPDEMAGREAACPCGHSFTITEKLCPFCGGSIRADAVKCPFCRSMLDGGGSRSDRIYRLLCLFGGLFGLHDFYAGRWRIAWGRFLLTAVGAVLAFHGEFSLAALIGLWCVYDLIRGMPQPETETSGNLRLVRLVFLILVLIVLLAALCRYIGLAG